MSRLLSIDVHCEKCDETYPITVEYDKRNDDLLCDLCQGGHAKRVYATINVSTSKTSSSMPDAVAKGRFDDLRRQREMQVEVSKAKQEYAKNPNSSKAEEIKRARTEKKKLKESFQK